MLKGSLEESGTLSSGLKLAGTFPTFSEFHGRDRKDSLLRLLF